MGGLAKLWELRESIRKSKMYTNSVFLAVSDALKEVVDAATGGGIKSVQFHTVTIGTDSVVNVPITAVDPTRSFVLVQGSTYRNGNAMQPAVAAFTAENVTLVVGMIPTIASTVTVQVLEFA